MFPKTETNNVLTVHDQSELGQIFKIPRSLVLVSFGAPWCVSCRMQTLILSDCAQTWGDQVVVATVDISRSPEIFELCRIETIPAIVVYREGRELLRKVGIQTQKSLSQALAGYGDFGECCGGKVA